jgi:hypothetical protein
MYGECVRESCVLISPIEAKMQLNLFQGTHTSAISLDQCADATSMHFFNERPAGQKNLIKKVPPHAEGEALLVELGNALEAFAAAPNRSTNN